jgi:O-antigen/teichoic acid export membrane protein
VQGSKRLSFTILVGVVVEILNKIVPLVVLSYVQKKLGVTAFGGAQFGIAIIEMAIPLVVFGYYHLGLVELSKKPSNSAIGHLISNLSALKLIHALLVGIGLAFMSLQVESYSGYFWLLIASSIALFFSGIDNVWLFIGTQKMAFVSFLIGLGRILSLVLILTFVQSEQDQIKFAIFYFLANGFVSATTAILAYRRYKLPLPDFFSMRQIISKAKHFALVPIMMVFIDRIDLIVVERLWGSAGAGLYAGPLRLSHSLFQVLTAIANAFLSEVIAINDRKKFSKHIHAGVWILAAVLVPMICGIWFVSGDLLSLIFDDSYRSVGPVLGIMIAGLLFNVTILVYGQQVLLLRGEERFFSLCLIGVVISILAMSSSLSEFWGLTGIAAGMLAAKFIGATFIVRRALAYIDGFPWRSILSSIIPGIIMTLALLLIDLDQLAAKLAAGAIIYALFFVIFNYKMIKTILHKIR